MTARRTLLALGILLCLAGLFAWLGPSTLAPPDVPVATVTRGSLDITLTVTGEMEAVNSVVVTAPPVGGQKKITTLVDEGALVAEGDVVVAFDTTDFLDEVRLAESDLEVIETRIKQQQSKAERELAALDVEIARAHIAVERAELTLTDSETVARVERERARLAVEEANISLKKMAEDKVTKEQDLAGELRLLELEKDKVKTRLARSRSALDACTVRAPTSGLVIPSRAWKGSSWGVLEEGDNVWPGQTVLQIPDLSALQVVVQVHEVDASLVAVGQAGTFSLDAFPGPVYAAEVSQMANLATTIDRGSKVKYFRTVLKVANTDPTMKPGMTAKVEVAVETLDDVLSIPREAVFEGDEGPRAWVKDGAGFTARAVELGKKNATHVVILSGLSEGDVVALADPSDASGGGEGAKPGAGKAPSRPDGA